jgi:hypothetical protein
MPDDFVRVGNDEDNSIIQLNQYADAWTGVVDSGVPLDMYYVNSVLKWAGRFRNISGSGNHVQICKANGDPFVTFTDDGTVADIWLGAAVRLGGLRTVDGISLWDHVHTGGAGAGLQIPTGGLVAGSVTATELDDDAVTTAKVLDANITAAKLSFTTMLLAKRQGGSATAWDTAGTTPYTPTSYALEAGVTTVTASSTDQGFATVTFQNTYTYKPIVLPTILYFTGATGGEAPVSVKVNTIATPPATMQLQAQRSTAVGSATFVISWLAIGPVA